MAHALTANAGYSDFDAATVTNHTLVFDALVFTTGTFVVTNRTENALTEETAWLGLECAVVDGLRVL